MNSNGDRRSGGDIFEINHFAGRCEFDFFQKFARADDGLDVALFGASGDGGLRKGIIQIDRDFAAELCGIVNQCAGNARRQEQTDHFLPAPDVLQAAGEENCFYQGGTKVDAAAGGIGHEEAAGMAAGAKDNGPPGPRALYHPHYYGAFVLDPDGNNIEAVCHSPA